MGIGLSLLSVFELARVTVPTFLEGVTGRIDPAVIDGRTRALGERVLARARVTLTVEGTERVPAGRAFVYMSNHQSHVDIPVVFATVPATRLRMVAKKELFRVPVWGRAMRAAGMVEVDRGNRSAAVQALERAGEQIRSGVSVWIAPEGTRSRTGAIGPLKKGGFHLALATGTPIVPIAISGTRRVLPAAGRSMRHGVPVSVRYGAPIEVAGRGIEELMAEVRSFFETSLAELEAG
ncbi:MAG: 1-acyl-sn-glycerol-3-phosphate acyltransferase [Polyangiaceae bacterium]|nr:1-acyl-sn-glycerol-3-phosphate acyltransferase [Polyangiaceae bacterium]